MQTSCWEATYQQPEPEVFEDAEKAGAMHVSDMARVGCSGKFRGNMHRDILAKMLKKSDWPQPYRASVHVFDPKTQLVVSKDIPILLPHELAHALHGKANSAVLFETSGMTAASQQHLLPVKEELAVRDLLAVSIWGDGVPCNWDRTESVECFTLSLPGLPDKWKNLRIPLAAITKKFVVKQQTFDDILEILTWSLRMCCIGNFPTHTHDGTAFGTLDRTRAKKALQPLGC